MTGVVVGPGRPKRYRAADGAQVVSVTTVLGQLGDASGLLHYQRECAAAAWSEGRSFQASIWAGHWLTKEAAEHGTRVHEAICATEAGGGYQGEDEAVLDALRAWSAWRSDGGPSGGAGLRIVAVEIPMVSAGMKLGGTLDMVAIDEGGRIWIVDIKTGRRLRGTHLLQLALYSDLWADAEDADPLTALRGQYGDRVHGVLALHLPRTEPGTWAADLRDGAQLERLHKAGRWAIQLVAALKGMDKQLAPRAPGGAKNGSD